MMYGRLVEAVAWAAAGAAVAAMGAMAWRVQIGWQHLRADAVEGDGNVSGVTTA